MKKDHDKKCTYYDNGVLDVDNCRECDGIFIEKVNSV